MIPLLRSAAALTAKEIHHHALAMVFITGWSLLMMPFAFASSVSGGGTSFVSAATGLAYYYGPIAVLLIVRRLVIQEYDDGTIRFLDALPAPAWLQFAVKTAVGLVASVGLVWAISLPLIAFAALREFVTFVWFLQLGLAIALYTTAWLALTFAIAHTGRFRHWIWMILFLLMATWFDGDWQLWTWHAALGLAADATRHAVPWSGFAISALWTVAMGCIAAFLAIFQGGAIPAAAFRSASTRERVTGTSLVLGLYLIFEVYPEMGAGTLNGWEGLPEPSARIHTVGDVGRWPQATEVILDRLEDLVPLDPPTTVILAADYSRSGPEVGPLVRTDLWDRDEVHIRVRGEPSPGEQARVIDALLEQRMAGLGMDLPDRGFAYDGLGLYLAESGSRPLAERRAAMALRRGLTEDQLGDWSAVRDLYGRDLAAGVGAIGLAAVETTSLGPWVGRVLLKVIPESGLAPLSMTRVKDVAGTDPAEFRRRWWAALSAIHATDLPTPWSAAVLRAEEPVSNLDISWVIEGEFPDGVELWVRPTDPIRGRPTPQEPDYRELVVPVVTYEGSTPTWFAHDDHLQVRLRAWEPAIEGWVESPLVELHP